MNDVPVNKPTVLVVDDEVQIRRLLRVTLEANGYRVVEASTEQKGLTEAAQRRPDTRKRSTPQVPSPLLNCEEKS